MWDALGLTHNLVLQSDLGITGQGTDLLVTICRALTAETYVTLSPVEKYLDVDKLHTSGIALRFARFRPPVYPQLWGEFRFNLSVLDLLLTCGPKALEILAHAQS